MADVSPLYADRSSQDFQPNTRGLARWIKQVAFHQQARRLLAQIGTPPTTVVDFACGSGLFTSCLADVLPRSARVFGSDLQTQAPADLENVEYRNVEHLDDLAGTADLVLAMHVVEHDDDPNALLRRIARLARPGGRIVIEVPNIDCIWTDVFGKWWDAWYLPYHRTHFSKRSLRALVDSAGLSILREVDISLPTMGRSLANLTNRRNSLMFILVGAALQPFQWLGEKLSRRPSALRIVALKI